MPGPQELQQLSREDLVYVIQCIRHQLWENPDTDEWDPDMDVNGGDLTEACIDVLTRKGIGSDAGP